MLALLSSPARLAFSAGVVAVSVVGVAGLTSSALFSGSDDLDSATFATGSVTLNSTDLNSGTWSGTLSGLAIGADLTRAIKVTNSGTMAGEFTVTEASTDGSDAALGSALQANLTQDACTATAGTSLYSGPLSSLAVSSGVALAAAGSDDLCLRVSLPTTNSQAGDNALQGLSYTSTLTFTLAQSS